MRQWKFLTAPLPCEMYGTLLRIDFVTQDVYGARVMRLRCCGTKWSVLHSVLMLGSMGRLRSTGPDLRPSCSGSEKRPHCLSLRFVFAVRLTVASPSHTSFLQLPSVGTKFVKGQTEMLCGFLHGKLELNCRPVL